MFFIFAFESNRYGRCGQVVMKIIKHGREAPSSTAHGLLLGLDLDGILEVSNSFALPQHVGDENDDKSTRLSGIQEFLLKVDGYLLICKPC